jgi:hypothetical protein
MKLLFLRRHLQTQSRLPSLSLHRALSPQPQLSTLRSPPTSSPLQQQRHTSLSALFDAMPPPPKRRGGGRGGRGGKRPGSPYTVRNMSDGRPPRATKEPGQELETHAAPAVDAQPRLTVAAGTKPYSDMKGILYVASRRLCSHRAKSSNPPASMLPVPQ